MTSKEFPAAFRKVVGLLLGLSGLLVGCTAPPLPPPASRVVASIPADALVVQRGVLTVRGRQFALNGYLAQSATGGRRLIVTEMFGHVLADVLIKHDGTIHVMRSSKLLRPSWVRRYVAADMECVFGGVSELDCPMQALSAAHFAIARRWYKLDLQIVEVKPGPQRTELFDAANEEIP